MLKYPLNEELVSACARVIESNKHKGNSWLDIPIIDLIRKLIEEYQEVLASWAKEDNCNGCLMRRELLDLINVASMLYWRLEQK